MQQKTKISKYKERKKEKSKKPCREPSHQRLEAGFGDWNGVQLEAVARISGSPYQSDQFFLSLEPPSLLLLSSSLLYKDGKKALGFAVEEEEEGWLSFSSSEEEESSAKGF